MSINWIVHENELFSPALLKEWLGWLKLEEDAHIFQHPALIQVWLKTYRPIRNLEIRILRLENEHGLLFWPLVKWTRNWKNGLQRILVPIGYSDFDYCDPILLGNKECLLKEAFAIIRNMGGIDTIQLSGFRKKYISCMQQGEPCPYIDLTTFKKPEDFLASMKSKMRCNIQYYRKKLEKEYGEIYYEQLTAKDLSTVLSELPVILEFHKKRWPQAYKAPHYHENLICQGLESRILHYSRLKVANKSISWRIGFILNDTFYSYMPTLNDQFCKYSPGKLHLLYCIEDAISMGLKKYDQMRGAEMYKSEWTHSANYIYNYRCDSTLLGSRIRNFLAESLKPKLKNIFHGKS